MQHSGANNLVETGSQLFNPLNRKLAKLKIFQIVFLLQLFGVMDTRRAEVDTRDLCRRPAHRMLGGLGGSTSCNQDGIVFAVRFVGPEKMKVSSPAVRIVPQTRVVFQAFHGPRIRIPLVEILHFLHATGSRRRLSFTGECHRRKRIQKKREVVETLPFLPLLTMLLCAHGFGLLGCGCFFGRRFLRLVCSLRWPQRRHHTVEVE